jgi:branched-chain amino acid transport system ATP-binding protein
MPIRARAVGVIPARSVPASFTAPAPCFSRPEIARSVVVLPHLPADAQAAGRPRARGRPATRERITPRTERPDLSGVPAALTVEGLSVREGELVGLIGPNGAGKTTLIDAISGFVTSTGTVKLGERDLHGQPPYVRAAEGLTRTWQSTELFDDLDVSENLTVAVREPAASDDVATQTLALVGMDWAAEAMPTQLSSGQRKLVGVARALVAKPTLLCLDEPAAGLDTAESEELGVTLRRLADAGQSMLLIEHDMGLVLGICDRVVVLEFGQVIAEGTPEAVRKDPKVIAAYLGDDMTDVALSGTTADSPEGIL